MIKNKKYIDCLIGINRIFHSFKIHILENGYQNLRSNKYNSRILNENNLNLCYNDL